MIFRVKAAEFEELSEGGMSAIWANDCGAGNKKILSIIFRISYLIGKREDAALSETFEMLESRLRTYFENEEKWAQSISPDFARHKLVHQCLLDDFKLIRKALEVKKGKWSEAEGNAFANSWVKSFVQHIREDGKQMAVLPVAHCLEFQPA